MDARAAPSSPGEDGRTPRSPRDVLRGLLAFFRRGRLTQIDGRTCGALSHGLVDAAAPDLAAVGQRPRTLPPLPRLQIGPWLEVDRGEEPVECRRTVWPVLRLLGQTGQDEVL